MKDKERDLFAEAGPKLTVSQAAIIQGFPSRWNFSGRKTAAYRQVGNAFPPPWPRLLESRSTRRSRLRRRAGVNRSPAFGSQSAHRRCDPDRAVLR